PRQRVPGQHPLDPQIVTTSFPLPRNRESQRVVRITELGNRPSAPHHRDEAPDERVIARDLHLEPRGQLATVARRERQVPAADHGRPIRFLSDERRDGESRGGNRERGAHWGARWIGRMDNSTANALCSIKLTSPLALPPPQSVR